MSYFSDASLVFIPSAQKSGKAYSVKPTDGTGDLTFTRSNDTASRVASNGLIEKVRTNLALYSEDQTNAAWSKTNVSVTGDTTANPVNGATTADTFTITTQTTVQGLSQSFTADGSIYTISVFLKKEATSKTISLKIRDSIGSGTTYATADLNLNTGVVSAVSGVASVVDYDANWWRLIVTTSTAPAAGTRSIVLRVANVAVSETFTVFGAMLEKGDIATPYIGPTLGSAVSVGPVANVPRLDYLNSSCPRLLLEPQRTNKQKFSEQINTTNYSVSNQINVTANAGVSPDGYTNADKIIPTTTSAFHQVRSDLATVNGYDIISVFVKASGYNYVQLVSWADPTNYVNFDLTDGTVGTVSVATVYGIQSYGNGWYRIWANVQASGAGIVGIGVVTSKTAGWSQAFAGNGTDGVLMWGVQIEAATYPSSYIGPTLGAAVTRGADAASKTGISSLIGSAAGTIYLEVAALANDLTDRRFALSDGTASNVARVGFGTTSNLILAVLFNGANQCLLSYTGADITSTNKIAFTWSSNDFALFVNGVKRASDTSGTTFAANTLTRLGFDNGAASGSDGYGKFDQVLLFKSRLSDSQLAELTA